ncbi:MAG: hypothetical protein HQL37_06295, partial [Alphaproteobacteria bacterium]|nr:hypothetical protein [Alphaproteobacteria bacterium]
SPDSIGWVDAAGLLCAHQPLKNDKGLEERAYIKTAEAKTDAVKPVLAYPGPEGNDCAALCRDLGAFLLYFVVDRRNGRLLLADDYLLEPGKQLVGWVDEKSALTWRTSIGMRPRETLVRRGADGKEEESTVCAFASLDQALANKNTGSLAGCRPILGGPVWYTLSQRM